MCFETLGLLCSSGYATEGDCVDDDNHITCNDDRRLSVVCSNIRSVCCHGLRLTGNIPKPEFIDSMGFVFLVYTIRCLILAPILDL